MNAASPLMVAFDPVRHVGLVAELTEILHLAYAPLKAQGLHYLATHQPPEKTLERLTEGQSWLIYGGGELAGTVSLYEGRHKRIAADYYRREGVWLFGQFGIHPRFQKSGLGSRVMDFLEETARGLGASELALDTAESADVLIAMYRRRGYDLVSYTQWPDVNYRSLILAKKLR